MNKLPRLILIVFIIFVCGISHAETKKKGKELLLEKREENLIKRQGVTLPEIKTQPGSTLQDVVLDTATQKSSTPEQEVYTIEKSNDDEIQEVIYDEQEITINEARRLPIKDFEAKRGQDRIKIRYPKILKIKGDESKSPSLRFLDMRGQTINEVKLRPYIPGKQTASQVAISNNKKYLAVTTSEEPQIESYVGETVVLNDRGEELWRQKHKLTFAQVSPNGKYIYGDDYGGDEILLFFDDSKEVKIRPASILKFSPSGGGGYIGVGYYTVKKNETGGYDNVLNLTLFDKTGRQIYRKENIEKLVDVYSWILIDVQTSDEGEVILIIRNSKTTEEIECQFDEPGNLINIQKLGKIQR